MQHSPAVPNMIWKVSQIRVTIVVSEQFAALKTYRRLRPAPSSHGVLFAWPPNVDALSRGICDGPTTCRISPINRCAGRTRPPARGSTQAKPDRVGQCATDELERRSSDDSFAKRFCT